MKILVLQGVPASGKSTYARDFVKDKKDWVIVSRDSIRESRGDYWIPEQEQYITDCEDFQIRTALKRRLNVIIDATNLNESTIEKWITISEEYNCKIEFKKFIIGYKEALERDKNRKRPVGEKVLKQFFRRYFPDELNEALNLVDNRPILKPNNNLSKCIIVDIDGTVALRTGRNPFDWSRVGEDKVDLRMVQMLRYFGDSNVEIFFLSGREGTEECRKNTREWLNINFPDFPMNHLIMRNKGDFRKDSIIKKELYEQHIKDKYDVVAVFDDRDSVVSMWRELGLLCCQVYYGNF